MTNIDEHSPDAFSRRSNRIHEQLTCDGIDKPFESLVNLLTDAMLWCDVQSENFHYALCLAGSNYLAEFNKFTQIERDDILDSFHEAPLIERTVP